MTDMEKQYPGNSHIKKERPKLEKVVQGEVIQRKKPLGRKIAETFTGDDARSVGDYVLFDILLPAFKDMIFDTFTGGLQRSLFGEGSRRGGSRRGGDSRSYTSYSSYRDDDRRREIRRDTREKFDYREIILATRAEAEEVLDQMRGLVDNYDTASITDLHEILGITSDYVNQKWGWTKKNFYDATVRRLPEGYLLDFPRPVPLD